MIYNSEALILNTCCYGDTSLICNLFTKKYGRLSIISKGARTLKNPNRAILQPAQFIDLHYYYNVIFYYFYHLLLFNFMDNLP